MLNKKYSDKLLGYQRKHTSKLINIIKANNVVLDASDTGTGKTYCAIATCAQLGLNPLIICPKAVISSWKKVCHIFSIKPFAIVNYESIKYGKSYDSKGNRIVCPFIDASLTDNFLPFQRGNVNYKWKIPKNCIFIFDEAHRCAKIGSLNNLLLHTAKDTRLPIMILSATITDNPKKFKFFYYVLNFIDDTNYDKYSNNDVNIEHIPFEKYVRYVKKIISETSDPSTTIHKMLYPNRAARMIISKLGKLFPDTQIDAIPYNVGKTREKQIQHEHMIIKKALKELKKKDRRKKPSLLVKILRARQKIELLKVPTFVELANDFKSKKNSIAIFVNFTQTLQTLATLLHTNCLVYSEQTIEERMTNINNFQ